MAFLDELRSISARGVEHEPLSKHVNFRLGGAARYFVEARTSDEIVAAVRLARRHGVRWMALGGGTNTLFSDAGFDGFVIKAANRQLTIDGNRVIAEAGAISALIARRTTEAGLAGFTWAISLPGTIGGAVRGNAGCFGGEMSDSVLSVDVLRNDEVVTLTRDELHFGYRHSVLKEAGNEDVILRVTIELTAGDKELLVRELDATLASRKATQPLYAASAGCMFKNVEFASADEVHRLTERLSVPEQFMTANRIPAGWIIDQLGLKGFRVGQASVSSEHGNFILNLGGATADEIAGLVAELKRRVFDGVGVTLQEEVRIVL